VVYLFNVVMFFVFLVVFVLLLWYVGNSVVFFGDDDVLILNGSYWVVLCDWVFWCFLVVVFFGVFVGYV